MKLCRFELLDSPGQVRSGIVHSGKIYETDGSNPIAVHEAKDVKPLPPVGLPHALRFFRSSDAGLAEDGPIEPMYAYGNPGALIGASHIVPVVETTGELDYEPYLALVVAADGYRVPLEEGDGLVLGLTLMNMFVARDLERAEAREGSGPGRSRDFAIALGPVLTTPDELESAIVDESYGRRYRLQAVSRVNGVERRRGDAGELSITPAQAIVAASESSPVRAGDVIAIGPLMRPDEPFVPLGPGDDVQIAVEHLGTLASKIA